MGRAVCEEVACPFHCYLVAGDEEGGVWRSGVGVRLKGWQGEAPLRGCGA